MDFPGGAVKFASYNATALVSDVTKGYVIPTSYFGNVYNITAVEVVAVTQGQLAIDVSNEKNLTETIEHLENAIHHFFFFSDCKAKMSKEYDVVFNYQEM